MNAAEREQLMRMIDTLPRLALMSIGFCSALWIANGGSAQGLVDFIVDRIKANAAGAVPRGDDSPFEQPQPTKDR